MRICHVLPILATLAIGFTTPAIGQTAADSTSLSATAPAIVDSASIPATAQIVMDSTAISLPMDGAVPTGPPPLSLAQCLAIAYQSNLGHRIDRANLESSREQLRQARAPFEFNADAGFTLPSYRESRDIVSLEALESRVRAEDTNFDYQGQIRVSQRVRNIGEFSLTGTGRRSDFSSNRRQDFRESRGELSFGYQQEIFTEPEEELQLRQAELSLTSDRGSLRRQRVQLETQVTNTYYNLVQAIRQWQIQEQRLEQSQSALDLAQRKFEIGLIAEVEALRLEVDKLQAEAEFAQATTGIESRRDELRQVLGMDMAAPLEVSTSVDDYELIPVDETVAVNTGLARRTDVENAINNRRLDQIGLKMTKQRVGPSATLNANINLTGRGPEIEDVGTSLERSLVSASIRVDLPLVDGGQQHAILRRAEIDLERSELNVERVRLQVILEIREAVRSVQEAERQIGLRDAALEVSERNFEVEQSRFELGLADSQELLDAQTNLTQSRTDALNAVVSYQRAMQSLRQATMSSPHELVVSAAD
jgi:outer membrane protein